MKIVKTILFLAVVWAILGLVSCKEDKTQIQGVLQKVPGNSTAVTAINLKSLVQKADFESIKQMAFYQAIINESQSDQPGLAAALANPLSSGIDLEQKAYISTVVDKANPEFITTYILLPLNDAGKFKKTLEGNTLEIEVQNGIHILKNNPPQTALGWNDDLAVAALTNSQVIDLPQAMMTLFEPGESISLAANKDAIKALDQNHDFATWMSTDALAESSAAKMGANMIELDPAALKGNYVQGYADFENGAIKGHTNFNFNKELGEKFIGRFFREEVKTDFRKILLKENLSFAAVGAMDIEGIDRFLSERPQSKGYADFALNDFGIKREDLVAMLGGDLMIAGYNNDNKISFLFATSINDNEKVKSFLAKAVEQKKLVDEGEGMYRVISVGNQDFSVTINKGMGKILMKDGMLIFSIEESILENIKNGNLPSSELADKETFQHFDNQTIGGWFLLDQLQRNMQGPSAEYFKELKFEVNGKGADFIIETKDPSTNSLQAVFQMINDSYLKSQLGKEEPM